MSDDNTLLLIIAIFGSLSGCLILVLIAVIIFKCCIRKRETPSRITADVNQGEAGQIPMQQIVSNGHFDMVCHNEQGEQNRSFDYTVSEHMCHVADDNNRPEPSAPPLPPEYYIEYT